MAEETTPIPVRSGASGSNRARARARLARFGGARPSAHPVLEPLLTSVRLTNPKSDVSVIERAYEVARAIVTHPGA